MLNNIIASTNGVEMNLQEILDYSMPVDNPIEALEKVEKKLRTIRQDVLAILEIDQSDADIDYIDENEHIISDDEESVTMSFKAYDLLMKTLEAYDSAYNETYGIIEGMDI